MKDAYLEAAGSTVTLLSEPAVAVAWDKPSALTGFTVGGLAGHLAGQVLSVEVALDAEVPDVERVTLLEHYARSRWVGAPLDDESNVDIRTGGERTAAGGAATLAADVAAAHERVRGRLAAESGDRPAQMPWWGWTMSLDDLLVTRMMEIAVHSDDLAVSVGLPTPPLSDDVLRPVLALLSGLSLRRHGPTALLRAYSRAERAPATISAF